MKTLKIYFPCLAACALLLTGNWLPQVPQGEALHSPTVALDNDDPGIFIFDTKFVRPPRLGDQVSAGDLQAVTTLLATYGQ